MKNSGKALFVRKHFFFFSIMLIVVLSVSGCHAALSYATQPPQTAALETPGNAQPTPAPTAPPSTPYQTPDLAVFADRMIEEPMTQLINQAYTLEEAYVPQNLVQISKHNRSGNLTLKNNRMEADSAAMAALNEMLAAAKADGVEEFYLASAYRTYGEQSTLWRRKREKYPSYGDDPAVPIAVAPPGSSEHQTGQAFDLATLNDHTLDDTFAETPQGQWLIAHAYEHGFILRYPEGKETYTGIVFEPWHYRYVGKTLSHYLTAHGIVLEEFYGAIARPDSAAATEE